MYYQNLFKHFDLGIFRLFPFFTFVNNNSAMEILNKIFFLIISYRGSGNATAKMINIFRTLETDMSDCTPKSLYQMILHQLCVKVKLIDPLLSFLVVIIYKIILNKNYVFVLISCFDY